MQSVFVMQTSQTLQHKNTLRLEEKGCHYTNISKCIFLIENYCILMLILLKFVPSSQEDYSQVPLYCSEI